MPARLIVNADDFGLTRGINRAVAELHTAGAVTSATLMANGPAFDDAVALAIERPTLGVGCHIVLTDGVPVSLPADIPTLLGTDRKAFRPSLTDFLVAVLTGKVSEDDILREALAQVQKLQRAGIDVTHLDTHKHAHILPQVARPLLHVAERCGIGAMRNPFEQPWSLAIGRSDPMRRLQVRLIAHLRPRFEALPQIRSGLVATTSGTLGISATGRLDAQTLTATLEALRNQPGSEDQIWELVCHPGYNDRDLDAVTTRLRASREIERSALLAAFGAESVHRSSPTLIHYGSLGSPGMLPNLASASLRVATNMSDQKSNESTGTGTS